MKNLHFDDKTGIDMTGRAPDSHFARLCNMIRPGLCRLPGFQPPAEVCRPDDLVSLPGFRRLLALPDEVYALAAAPDGSAIYIHAGSMLYRLWLPDAMLPIPSETEVRNIVSPAVAMWLDVSDADGNIVMLYDVMPGDHAASFAVLGGNLYVTGATCLLRIDPDGRLTAVCDAGTPLDGTHTAIMSHVTLPYVPLLTREGAPLEARNLLTDRFREVRTLSAATVSCVDNSPFVFEITDPEAEIPTCRIIAMHPCDVGDVLVIPSTTVVRGITCAVTGIASTALAGGSFTAIQFPYTMRKIAAPPLTGCSQVTDIVIPRGVYEIYMSAFNECSPNLTIRYEGLPSEWDAMNIYESEYLGTYSLYCGSGVFYTTFSVPLATPATALLSCTLDGVPLGTNLPTDAVHMTEIRESATSPITRLLLRVLRLSDIEGRVLSLTALATPFTYGDLPVAAGDAPGVLSIPGVSPQPTGARLVSRCRALAVYDGRLFFAGSPDIPDVFFYAHADADGTPRPDYVGVYNYQTDGARMPVVSLLAADGDLLVLRGDGASSCLTAHAVALPDVSPSLFGHLYPIVATQTAAAGARLFCLDGRPYLLTSSGLFLLRRSASGGFQLTDRGARIAPAIAAAARSGAAARVMALPGAPLLILGDRMYIADMGAAGVEWYPADAPVSYSGDAPAVCAATYMPDELRDVNVPVTSAGGTAETLPLRLAGETAAIIPPCPLPAMDETVDATDGCVYRRLLTVGEAQIDVAYYHGQDAPFCILLDSAGTRIGGTASPPVAIALCGERIFAACGHALLAMNTDLNGTDSSFGFPREAMYTDGHPRECFFETFDIDCGYPNLRKRVYPGSAVLTLGTLPGSDPCLTCFSDGGVSYRVSTPAAPAGFTDLDFGIFTFTGDGKIALPLPEPTYPFRVRRYALSATSPLIYQELSFCCTVAGLLR